MADMDVLPDAKGRAGRVKAEIDAAGAVAGAGKGQAEGKSWPPAQQSKGPSPVDRVEGSAQGQTHNKPPTNPVTTTQTPSTTATTKESSKKREVESKVIEFKTIGEIAKELTTQCVMDPDTGEIIKVTKKGDRNTVAAADRLLTDVFWSVNGVYVAHAAEFEMGSPSEAREKVRKAQTELASESERKKYKELWECDAWHSEGHPRPPLAHTARLFHVLAKGIDKLTMKEGVIYDEDGKQNVFYTELLGVMDYAIVELAKEHNDEKARELVDSLPHLARMWEEMDDRRDSVQGYLRRVHVKDAHHFVPQSQVSERVRQMTR